MFTFQAHMSISYIIFVSVYCRNMTKSHVQPLTKVSSMVSEPVQGSTQTPEWFASDSMIWRHTYVCLLNISSAHGLVAIANRVY